MVPTSTASMSARGIITSSTRTSRRRNMLLSMARSPGEKDSACSSVSASASAISSRRLEPFLCLKRFASRSRKVVRLAEEYRRFFYQFDAEYKDQFTWDYLEEGPDVWRVRIGRPAA